jgi:hypothetical protein
MILFRTMNGAPGSKVCPAINFLMIRGTFTTRIMKQRVSPIVIRRQRVV